MTTHGKGSANLTVKVYVNPVHDTSQQEIRRLVFEKGQPPLEYFTLEANIRRVFPYLAGRKFKLCWKDPENELISFSSDEELKDAIESMSGDILRVFVTVDSHTMLF